MSYGLLGGFDYGRVLENRNINHKAQVLWFVVKRFNVVTARLTYFISQEDKPRPHLILGLILNH
jgi:hypothetical protein